MAKEGTVSGRVDKSLIAKAKEQNLNISEAIEEVLKEKTKDPEKSTLILQVEKYGISLIPNNWVVGRVRNASVGLIEGAGAKIAGIFDKGTESYHPNLHQALIQLSKRLLEDKIKVACKEKVLEIKELAQLIQAHHDWFVNLVRGM